MHEAILIENAAEIVLTIILMILHCQLFAVYSRKFKNVTFEFLFKERLKLSAPSLADEPDPEKNTATVEPRSTGTSIECLEIENGLEISYR